MAGAEKHRELSDNFIAAMEAGIAPWQRPWAPDDGRATGALFNPVSATGYGNGINALKLLQTDHADPRWCTYEQAASQGWQVKRGSRGISLSYMVRNGKTGASVVRTGVVFNAEQIQGIPELERLPSTVDLAKLSDRLRSAMGVEVVHDQQGRSFYSVTGDKVHIQPPASYKDEASYHADLMHQLLHATGRADRMNRDMGRSFTSLEYAREELATEIATLFLARDLGMPFEPADHQSYTASWIKLMREDERTLAQAVLSAKGIVEYVKGLDVGHEFFQASPAKIQAPAADRVRTPEKTAPTEKQPQPANDRIYLFVPYEERKEAGKLGARLDETRKPKQWYITANMDAKPFEKWLAPPKALTPQEIIQQFRMACTELGLVMDEDPSMDEKWHHVHVSTSRNRTKRSGAYVLNRSGLGYIKNHDTGIETAWRPEGHIENDSQSREQMAQMEANKEARDRARLATQEGTAKKCGSRWGKLPHAPEAHPYLVRKHIKSFGLRLHGENLIVPLIDEQSRIWNLQRIPATPGKTKLYEKDARKQGLFYVLGSMDGASTVLFGEGYATCASMHMATGLPVVICFDSGNIEAVIKLFEPRLAGVDKIICGDNDLVTHERLARTLNGPMREKCGYPEITSSDVERAVLCSGERSHVLSLDLATATGGNMDVWHALQDKFPLHLGGDFWMVVNEDRGADHYELPRLHAQIFRGTESVHKVMVNNAGMEKALGAAASTGAKVVAPHFKAPDAYQKGWKDFNDLHVQEGLEQVCAQIGAAVDLLKGREEAARFVREAKHNLIEVAEPAPDGRYVGVVIGRAGFHAVQDVGRNAAVAHPLNGLDRVPNAGEMTRIQYEGGRGKVTAGQALATEKKHVR